MLERDMNGRFIKGHIPWHKGKTGVYSKDTLEKMSKGRRGKIPWNKKGLRPLHDIIRRLFEYKEWRTKVFQRDNYTCQDCLAKGKYLHAHHKKRFAILLQEFLEEYNQFSPMEDKETLVRLATKWKPFWEIDNGETLCKDCHELTKNYAKNFIRR